MIGRREKGLIPTLCAVVLIAAPVSAQEGGGTGPSPGPTVRATADTVVVAPRHSTRSSIRSLAAAVAGMNAIDVPMARLSEPLCLRVTGLSDAYASAIAARVADNARAAGLSVARSSCVPNVLAAFVGDGRAELAEVLRSRPGLLNGVSPSAVRALLAERGPVRAWITQGTRGEDGQKLNDEGGSPSGGGPPQLKLLTASRITPHVRTDMATSVIVIDRAALTDRSPAQVADYATMRTLTAARPARPEEADTILSLFGPGAAAAPKAMTAFDRGFLRAFYSGSGAAFPDSTIDRISYHIVRSDDWAANRNRR